MGNALFHPRGARTFSDPNTRFAIIGAILLALFFGLFSFEMGRGSIWNTSNSGSIINPSSNTPHNLVQATEQERNEEQQTIDLVKQATNAVVSISASNDVPRLEACDEYSPDQRLSPWNLEHLLDPNAPLLCEQGTERQRTAAGTGFIVSSDGYILTNKHLVENTSAQYTITLNDPGRDGERLPATVVAHDPNNDIAVLKIEGENYPFLSFADSSKLQVGQTTIAIGYALGEFDNSVSKGVVSGLGRSIEAEGVFDTQSLTGLIQTDTAINPGNSGGPLLDIDGRVVGMNTAIAFAQNIGFAIPANEIRASFEEAKQAGEIVKRARAFLGVRTIAITPELQSNESLSYDYGAWIQSGPDDAVAIVPSSPASQAGLKEGDIILEINGKRIDERFSLSDALRQHEPGDEIALKVSQGGAERMIYLTLTEE